MSDLYIDISRYIENFEQYRAHTTEGKEPESLWEHMEQTREHLDRALYKSGTEACILRMIDTANVSENVKQFIYKAFLNGIYLHDLGKINPAFQCKKMRNPLFPISKGSSNHSMLSTFIYYWVMQQEIEKQIQEDYLDEEDMIDCDYLTYLFGYMISKHHGHLDSLTSFAKRWDQWLDDVIQNISHAYDSMMHVRLPVDDMLADMYQGYDKALLEEEGARIFPNGEGMILAKLFYALLVNCDYAATSAYMLDTPGTMWEEGGFQKILPQVVQAYKKTPLYQSIQDYKGILDNKADIKSEEVTINDLRSRLFIEAEMNYHKNPDKRIYYLEAPTGSGKTNTSLNLALHILEYQKMANKLFYIFPFNTLIDQTEGTLKGLLQGSVTPRVFNSITPISTEELEEDVNKSYLNYLFMNHPLILTTHVQFFRMLFGVDREANIPFSELVGSVVILDEIQSYSIQLWKELIYFIDLYGELLNMTVIIMSATLPKLNRLLDLELSGYANLIESPQAYFEHPLFKNRVGLDYSMIDQPLYTGREKDYEGLANHILKERMKRGPSKILVEFLTVKSAMIFYDCLMSMEEVWPKDCQILSITGRDNRNMRKKTVQYIKEAAVDCVLITTQVIEAGVDIDMDLGYKSIAYLDADEQFLGRVNRSCKKKDCKVFFFDMDEAKWVYRKDFRMERTLHQEQYRRMLEMKQFDRFYQDVFTDIERVKEQCNEDNFVHMRRDVTLLDYAGIEEKMTLIEEKDMVTLYLNVVEEIREEIDGRMTQQFISGDEVWRHYVEVLEDRSYSYAHKQIELSRIRSKMDYFTYQIYRPMKRLGYARQISQYQDKIGDMYYIDQGERYLKNGHFDIEAAMELFGETFTEDDFL